MNILVLKPGRQELSFACFSTGSKQPVCAGQIDDCRNFEEARTALSGVKKQWAGTLPHEPASFRVDGIAVRGIFGGGEFDAPALATDEVIRRLEKLVASAPMHIPALLALLHACRETFADTPVVLMFETAFFAALPARERFYAVNPSLPETAGLRRFGYHGILHAAACREAARKWRRSGMKDAPRILSFCLEPRPEAAAVIGEHPVLVTSGATPLEGLPGRTTCGEMDPSIVLMMAQKKGWGPEQINDVLTRQSGWLGLTGRMAGLDEIFGPVRPEYRMARSIMEYRLLQVCGAGLAAMGRVDVMVFSGVWAALGSTLGRRLKKKLDDIQRGAVQPTRVEIFRDPLLLTMAEEACAVLLAGMKER